ncbi:hypothetical protein B0H67DRAFT_290849 [Lasiosphaeris hirsuta]|uniref:Uncharacterized protein n=1 Tax=Lasiosphaeris hirsuta TaxID=260670 RepID=A0AA40A916_9PEZI|nr:hypothetical protein B0H67DRAFT_290849 [Lasiosphaeris hirsuta]
MLGCFTLAFSPCTIAHTDPLWSPVSLDPRRPCPQCHAVHAVDGTDVMDTTDTTDATAVSVVSGRSQCPGPDLLHDSVPRRPARRADEQHSGVLSDISYMTAFLMPAITRLPGTLRPSTLILSLRSSFFAPAWNPF